MNTTGDQQNPESRDTPELPGDWKPRLKAFMREQKVVTPDIIAHYIETRILPQARTLLAGRMQERDEALDTASAMLKRVREEVQAKDKEINRLRGIMKEEFTKNYKYPEAVIGAMWQIFCWQHNITDNPPQLLTREKVLYKITEAATEIISPGNIITGRICERVTDAVMELITDNQTDKT